MGEYEDEYKRHKEDEEEAWREYRLAKFREQNAWDNLGDALHDLSLALEKMR